MALDVGGHRPATNRPGLIRALRRLRPDRYRTWLLVTLFVVALAVLGGLTRLELRTSWAQAKVLSTYAAGIDFDLRGGASDHIYFPKPGPYDVRYGYAKLPGILESMSGQPFRITAQARVSPQFKDAMDWGLFPIYREKNQAGLRIVDRAGSTFYEVRYPRHIYASFEDVPPLVWRSLLYIENRNMLNADLPYRNPAIEWNRFSRALADEAMSRVGIHREGAGGSTLATQLEKLRHSPGGLTDSGAEKIRQMATASLRSYLDGRVTMEAQRLIVRNYLNAMPLAAVPGFGEVTGLGDGLMAWFGSDVEVVNELLITGPSALNAEGTVAQAVAYRQILSLFLADRRPSYYLGEASGRVALRQVVDEYLRILERDGVITATLRDAALQVSAPLQPRARSANTTPFAHRKAANSVRAELLNRFGIARLYDLDHYDVTVRTTYDDEVQQDVSNLLTQFGDPAFIDEHGLGGYRLLGRGDPSQVSYAIVVYEAAAGGNLIRVQADNFDGPFDINRGSKLELGSTAKLRTLVTYLQIADTLYRQYARLPSDRLRAIEANAEDPITTWALSYLRHHPGATRSDMLEAALDRRYSAGTGERFFTGGGLHVFSNFSGSDDSLSVTVRSGFRRSVNLVFIRIMRDVAAYYLHRLPGTPADMLTDVRDPRRGAYLARFADREGLEFTETFYRRYHDSSTPDRWETFTSTHRSTHRRLAWAYRSVNPDADSTSFAQFLRTRAGSSLAADEVDELFRKTDTRTLSWQDKGYLAGVHPLELWLMHYVQRHDDASWQELSAAGTAVRQEVYRWLLDSKHKSAQDWRIRTLLEEAAFKEIHHGWKQLGYPFDSLVPSLATAIGSSADRPDALAELVGIIVRDGLRYSARQLDEIHFAADTPFETVLSSDPMPPLRVLSPEVAAALRNSLIDVVEHGTAVRARAAVTRSNGSVLTIGGKTGTGDNRRDRFGPRGQRIGSQPVNRTATFVFFIGDRFFGVVTAYVSGPKADDFTFTSSLPTQILKTLGPALRPLFESDPGAPSAPQTNASHE